MKIHPVGAELFHADGRMDEQTYMTLLAVAFRHFANATRKTGNVHIKIQIEARSRNHCCRGKAIRITQTEYKYS